MDVKRVLESVGYRVLPDGDCMCKPFGFSVLKFKLSINSIYRHFYGRGSVTDILTWSSEVIETKDKTEQEFLEAVAAFEEYNQGMHGRYVNFAFETKDQFWNNTL